MLFDCQFYIFFPKTILSTRKQRTKMYNNTTGQMFLKMWPCSIKNNKGLLRARMTDHSEINNIIENHHTVKCYRE